MDNRVSSSSSAIHPDFPLSVKVEIEQALGTGITHIERPRSGISKYTYLVGAYLIGDEGHTWVAWVEEMPAPRFRASFVAQQKAASVGVPVPAVIAHRLEGSDPGDYIWTVEEYVQGDLFRPEELDRETRLAISADLGRQLRRLHTIEVKGFGSLKPDPLRGAHNTWEEWLDAEEANVEPAVHMAGIRSDALSTIREAYAVLREAYTGSARLCHGDFTRDNLFVEGGRLVAAIDWQDALACDPAYDVTYCYDIAYWCERHESLECLHALLSAYEPTDPVGFRERVLAHRILLAIDFMVWYAEQENEDGVEACRGRLENASRILPASYNQDGAPSYEANREC